MYLIVAAARILNQLADMVNQISSEDFSRPSETLGGASIGKHVRHTLEFFLCFKTGCSEGIVNYDRRAHNVFIERDKAIALDGIQNMIDFVRGLKGNCLLQLEVGYNAQSDICETIDTSMMRELVYNIEHAVHHMAMIRIALREVASYIQVAENFGVAASTARYHGSIGKANT